MSTDYLRRSRPHPSKWREPNLSASIWVFRCLVVEGGRGDKYQANCPTHAQNHIDQIVATSPSTLPRRTKIYCDKWVHEGVCAFTQQGCKFKHEMPLDKATQMSLGLFHGLPAWWKKQQMEHQQQRQSGAEPVESPGSLSATTSPRRAVAPTPPSPLGPQQSGWWPGAVAEVVASPGSSMRNALGIMAPYPTTGAPAQDGSYAAPLASNISRESWLHWSSVGEPAGGMAMSNQGQPAGQCVWGPIGQPPRSTAASAALPSGFASYTYGSQGGSSQMMVYRPCLQTGGEEVRRR